MKRVFILLAVCAVAVLLPAAAMATSLTPLHSPGHSQAAGLGVFAAGRAPLRYVPLARTLTGTGTGTLSGRLLTYAGTADAGAHVNWWVNGTSDSGTGTTDGTGAFSLGTVPVATGTSGEVSFASSSGNVWFDRWNMTWPDSGTNLGTLQPGGIDMILTETSDPYWKGWSTAYVELSDNEPATLSETGITRTDTNASGTAEALPGSLDGGALYYWMDQGVDLSVSGLTISPGSSAATVWQDQDSACGVWTSGWGSGKPGTHTWLMFEHFPANWTNYVTGLADWPQSSSPTDFGAFESIGTWPQGKRLTIPSGAAVGYKYWLSSDQKDGPLSLRTSFQTCTLNASKLTIRKGTRIKLSGVVPVKGHLGSTPGITSKRAIIYKTTKSTGQPTTWTPKSSIWTKVATVRVSGLGKFSRYVSPSRTTRYVVRYPGDEWYWGAFTSVRKVTVR